ncbi:MAG: hypothetical protein OXC46_11850 [Thaumarchaeota archaeon]|nr:hypothetical protein [Nitrososphaerota archaeon]
MGKTRVVVYGLSTEGYAVASHMAVKGADVHIIDEAASSAISLKAEVAKTYPDVSSLKEDEPLLAMEPINIAISKAQYMFFTPRIRRTGQDVKIEINSQFKDAISALPKNSSIVYSLPTGFGGNLENISLLEHVTGLEAGKKISYFYYPLSDEMREPKIIGAFNGVEDARLSELLSKKKEKKFVSLPSSEYFHAINVLSNFTDICAMLEVCKFAQDKITRDDMSYDGMQDIFIDDMVNCMFDLKSLAASFEGTNTMMYLINGGIKGIDSYVKRLIDVVRSTLKKNEMKASRTKIALSWSFDKHEMRNDKTEMLQNLTMRLRDYIGDVETFDTPNFNMFHSDKTTIVVACSKTDYDVLVKSKQDSDLIIIKANPICEVT